MAFTVTQLAAVETAIATGELIVWYDGNKIEYRSINELIAARNLIRQELLASGQLSAPTSTTVSYGRRVR